MSIRVFVKLHLSRILLESLPTRSTSTHNTRFFSESSARHGAILSESSSASDYSRQISIASLLLRYGFPQSQLHEFFRKHRFLMSSSPSDVEKCIGILLSYGLNQNSLVSIISSCPQTLELGFLTKWKVGFSELECQNLAPSFVQRTLEQSAKLKTEPSDLHYAVQLMKSLSLSGKTIFKVLEEFPLATIKHSGDIRRTMDMLKSVGFNNEDIDRICHLFPGILACNINGRLRLLFGELQDLNFRLDEVKQAFRNHPKLLLSMEHGELTRYLDLLNSLKCRVPIKKMILSNGRLAACINVKLRVDFLCQYGLICREAFKILFVEPRVLIYDLEDVEKKIDFLISKLNLCIKHLVEFPDYLGVNFDKQIIPRFNVVEHLISRGGLGFNVGLKHLVRLSRHKFYNFFVKPYPECEKIFGGLVREAVREAKPRHPVDMWKLLKPQKFTDTEEDVKNMKLLMKSLV
ncbi:transcription termination factor MTERF15, mitochondrial-like isoform X1 [Zingiber officinale]|uniref:Uncharacterized protein n=2 Tax=Zingiber officinale TaxID=94328 RepID=A0A8J5HPD0_ZINOF|nr:transcription termination factor MTERF15, mitochondrial-like isoform X1 [Zingiber officinale]KAG6533148.1 hypothetical protein ZIOFF_007014 [Zingiber officinale]